MLPSSFKIETSRLAICQPRMEEIPEVYEATQHEGFNDGLGWDPLDNLEDFKKPYRKAIKSWNRQDGYSFSIRLKTNDQFIGRISIGKDRVPKTWSLGFWTLPKHQGNGYMSEAVTALLDFGFNHLKAEIIQADYAVWNQASKKVLTNNGMTFVKCNDQGLKKKGKWVPTNLMQINRTSWKQKT